MKKKCQEAFRQAPHWHIYIFLPSLHETCLLLDAGRIRNIPARCEIFKCDAARHDVNLRVSLPENKKSKASPSIVTFICSVRHSGIIFVACCWRLHGSARARQKTRASEKGLAATECGTNLKQNNYLWIHCALCVRIQHTGVRCVSDVLQSVSNHSASRREKKIHLKFKSRVLNYCFVTVSTCAPHAALRAAMVSSVEQNFSCWNNVVL